MNNQELMYSRYTTTYEDFLKIENQETELWQDLTFVDNEHLVKLKEMIYNIYRDYEINGETLKAFKERFRAMFKRHNDYYVEKIKAYETKIEMLDGVVGFKGDRIDTELPNYKTSSMTPSFKNEYSMNGGKSNYTPVEAREMYMDAIRNIYEEYANSMRDSFLIIYY